MDDDDVDKMIKSFDPSDVAALEGNADWVAKRANNDYCIYLKLTGLQAMELLDRYNRACDGEVVSISDMFDVVHQLAAVVEEALEIDPEELAEE